MTTSGPEGGVLPQRRRQRPELKEQQEEVELEQQQRDDRHEDEPLLTTLSEQQQQAAMKNKYQKRKRDQQLHPLTDALVLEQEQEPPTVPDGLDDDASEHTAAPKPPDFRIFVALGLANASDATEILCLNYLLLYYAENDSQDGSIQGALAATVFAGMLVGGLGVGAWSDTTSTTSSSSISSSDPATSSSSASAEATSVGAGAGGRRTLLLWSLALTSVTGLVSALFLDHPVTLCWIRFCTGLGVGAMVPPLFALASELASPLTSSSSSSQQRHDEDDDQSHRGYYVTVVASFWMVGSLYVALVAWWCLGGDKAEFSGNWQWFLVWCALPSGLGYVAVSSFVPESPRYLALVAAQQHEQHDPEQSPVLGNNTLPSASITASPEQHDERRSPRISMEQQRRPTFTWSSSSERRQGWWERRLRRIVSVPVACWVRYAGRGSDNTLLQIYQTGHMLRIAVPLQVLWFSLNFGSYGLLIWINRLLVQILPQLQGTGSNNTNLLYVTSFWFALANLPGNILSAVLMDRMGRSRLFLSSIMAAAGSLLVFAHEAADTATGTSDEADDSIHQDDLATSSATRTWMVVLAACAFQCFSISAWNAIDVMTSELFPTAVRSTGLGVCTASGRVGAVVAQLVNSRLLVKLHDPVRLLWVAALTLLLGCVIPALILAPLDKTGQPIEDTVGPVATDSDNQSINGPVTATDGDPFDSNLTIPIDGTNGKYSSCASGNSSRLFPDHL